MEISDCTSVSAPEFESDQEAVLPRPKGLAAIPDSLQASLHAPLAAPKPNLIWRGALTLALSCFHLLVLNLRFIEWVIELFTGPCQQKAMYRELHAIALEGDRAKIEEFLEEHPDPLFPACYLVSEVLSIPGAFPHLPAILEGANVCLAGDRGAFCQKWKTHPKCVQRISSHNYREDESFAIDHILFWVDPEGNTRFQLERSPLDGFFSALEHTIDYLRYKRDNEQQGVVGASPHTEDFCLRLPIY
ncbi:MAG: hypothetical protein KGQ49_02015 [Verrucomicrobia bacterium]|nr:hypothetical protein [Verrucomicrobiota bacterium]MBU6446156.1 hypothetical protein [Verrucomicrobiota bacterium]